MSTSKGSWVWSQNTSQALGTHDGHLDEVHGHYYHLKSLFLNSPTSQPCFLHTLVCTSWSVGFCTMIKTLTTQWFKRQSVFFCHSKKMCKSQRANMKVLRCPEARYLLFLFTDMTRKWYRSLLLIPHCQHYVTWLHLATRKPGKCSLWVGCQPLMCKGDTR